MIVSSGRSSFWGQISNQTNKTSKNVSELWTYKFRCIFKFTLLYDVSGNNPKYPRTKSSLVINCSPWICWVAYFWKTSRSFSVVARLMWVGPCRRKQKQDVRFITNLISTPLNCLLLCDTAFLTTKKRVIIVTVRVLLIFAYYLKIRDNRKRNIFLIRILFTLCW